jgi:hypothetical protein
MSWFTFSSLLDLKNIGVIEYGVKFFNNSGKY